MIYYKSHHRETWLMESKVMRIMFPLMLAVTFIGAVALVVMPWR